MGFFDDIFGSSEPAKTATPNLKAPLNKSQPVETLTPVIAPPALATPKPVEDKYYHISDEEWDRLQNHETGIGRTKQEREAAQGDPSTKQKGVKLAVGPAQIHPEFVKQVNNLLQVRARRGEKVPPQFTLADRSSTEKSRQMVDIHQYWIGREFESKFGRPPTFLERAQLHQAGSMGSFNSDSNKAYKTAFEESQKKYDELKKQKEEQNKKK